MYMYNEKIGKDLGIMTNIEKKFHDTYLNRNVIFTFTHQSMKA